MDTWKEVLSMSGEPNALDFLRKELSKKQTRTTLSFNEYLELVQDNPGRMLRNIFQQFYDMMDQYVSKEDGQHSEDPESIGFLRYDFSKLFIEGSDNPFFADTPFANRLVRQAEGLRQGFQQNRMYVYDGPSGCGKSTFLNNILRSFEAYTNTPEGRAFEIYWEIDEGAVASTKSEEPATIFVPCPSHDYPILIIPKDYRADFLKRLLPEDSELTERMFQAKEYSWLFQAEACTICKSIFWALFEKLGSLDEVLSMVKARTYKFDRRTGEGISIFNPSDTLSPSIPGKQTTESDGALFTHSQIQDSLDRIFGINTVRYVYSPLAKTNNGIYGLMDIKAHNKNRLLSLHNVISEGVHKVGDIEERIQSLFFALMNPEDKTFMDEENFQSFLGRVQFNPISYVLEPVTEANIYRNIFGKSIDERFLPRVLENFARVIISSRMNERCEPQEEWIPDIDKYKMYCDEHGLLLRMELYSNNIPSWLSEEDRKKFTSEVRRNVIGEGQKEGKSGFSGRESIALFRDFLSTYRERDTLINMEHVTEFFKRGIGKERRDRNIPKKFLGSLVDSYDYAVLNEVKEALYFYNKKQISQDILNYLCMVSYDVGDIVRCQHTGKDIEVTVDFLKLMASRVIGREVNVADALSFAREVQKKYVTIIVSKPMEVVETELYQDLFDACVRNLKDAVLQPFIENKNFREAIKCFGDAEFIKLEPRLKERVSRMMENLTEKFGYSAQGAKEVCLYVLDNNLVEKFSSGN